MARYFKDVNTLEELRKQCKDLLKKYHPDNTTGSMEASRQTAKKEAQTAQSQHITQICMIRKTTRHCVKYYSRSSTLMELKFSFVVNGYGYQAIHTATRIT